VLLDLGGFCRCLVALWVGVLTSGCAAARLTPVGHLSDLDRPMTTVALAPQGGLFADLVGFELAQRGCTVIDTGGTLALLVLMHKSAAALDAPEVMPALAQRGIDAVLTIETVPGKDHAPEAVQARLRTTSPATELGGVDWRNRWGRRSPIIAAGEIAAALAEHLCKSPAEAPSRPSADAAERSPLSRPLPAGRH
jgi:hypothetical protein